MVAAADLKGDARHAHLAVQGWVPVRKRGPVCEFGLFYPAGGVGFAVWYPDPREGYGGGAQVLKINLVNFPNDSVWVECAWSELFDDTLDIIEKRLAQT